ncbi:MAG: tripartite tricarboxylate transporter TctB family protein [Burkholderiales bacterium]|nr:tripartite tricarboxylate transporter TctB family protein [Burkholderiales bacterium]
MNDDLKLGSVVLAFCAFLWFYAIPYHIKGALPALLPKSLVIAMMIPCVLFFYKGIEAAEHGVSASAFRIIPGATLKALGVIPLMLVYIFLIDLVGFYVITGVFIFIFLLYFEAKPSLSLYIYPVALPLIVYLLIGRVLHFPLPDGILF